MKNDELLKKVCPVSQPRIPPKPFCFITTTKSNGKYKPEISTLDPKLQAQFMDLVIEYMEETMNWPEPDNQETFEKQITGIMP